MLSSAKHAIFKWMRVHQATSGLAALKAMHEQTSHLEKVGWFQSFLRRESVDRYGKPIPWITYGAIAFMEPRLHSDMSVFEFGSGNSTLWWASRVKKVTSCEHDFAWYSRVKDKLPDNVEYIFADASRGRDYADVIKSQPAKFDVVVIDGHDRVNCARSALHAIKESGVIIWDNTHRAEYAPGFELLGKNGFRRIDFSGMTPIFVYDNTTSIFYRRDNCFGI